MRNVFDQYDQPENKLTHALISTLNNDKMLIRPFLRWLKASNIPSLMDIRLVEQQLPGITLSGDETESKGLPDACFYSDDGWALLVESKVQASINLKQLQRHHQSARRHGFENPYVVLIAVDRPAKGLPDDFQAAEWREVYQWFSRRANKSLWAKTFTDYMHIFESRMIAHDYSIRGTLTMFDGLRFDVDNPYTYREGKRLIRLLGDELRKRKDLIAIGVDLKGEGRPAITGQGSDRVWDFLPLKIARKTRYFTAYPHLTMGVNRECVEVAITVPNGVRGSFRTKLKKGGIDGFRLLITQLEKRLRLVLRRSNNSKPIMYVLQRHYKSQKSVAETDARLDLDLRTFVQSNRSIVKYQPQWVDSVYQLLINKRSNIQFGVMVRFSYDCPIIRSRKSLDLFAESWIAMSPLLEFVCGKA